jgi:hypothetical protein
MVTRRARSPRDGLLSVLRVSVVSILILALGALVTFAQNPAPNTDTLKKANTRPAEPIVSKADPFDGASVEKMTGQCVTLETESGAIVIEMLPAAAPETVRSFLNLAATGALDTTTFSRVVRGFVIQGGNLSTNEKWSAELAERMSRHLPDEPSKIQHVRGIVSMARGDEPQQCNHAFLYSGWRRTAPRRKVCGVWPRGHRDRDCRRDQSRARRKREARGAGAHQTRRRGPMSEVESEFEVLVTPSLFGRELG